MKKLSIFIMTLSLLPSLAFAVGSTPLKIIGGGGEENIVQIAMKLASYLLYIGGILAVVLIIVGGVRYIVAFGSPDQTEKAKKTIIYALIGLVVCAMALTAVNITVKFFGGSGGSGGSAGSSGGGETGGTGSGTSTCGVPDVIKGMIGKMTGVSTVKKCSYEGKDTYVLPTTSTDPKAYTEAMYDASGALLCYVSGGYSGMGDGKCPSYHASVCSVISGCSSGSATTVPTDPSDDLPDWIKSKGCDYVAQCNYSGGTGYDCTMPGADSFNPFFNSTGAELCTSGGSTGLGDGKCPALSINSCKNVWTRPGLVPVITEYPQWAKDLANAPNGSTSGAKNVITACKGSNGSTVFYLTEYTSGSVKYTTYDDKGTKICSPPALHSNTGCPAWAERDQATNCANNYSGQ